MKRLLALLLCAVMLFSVLGAEAWAADSDTLTVYAKSGGRRNVKVGDTVTYSYALKLTGIYELDSVRLDVVFDEECLEFVSVEYPSFKTGDATETVKNGVLHMEKSAISNGGAFSQSISDILTVTFRAKRAGTTYIRTLPQRIEVEAAKDSDIYLIENYRPNAARDALFSTYDYLGDNTPSNATTKLNTSQDVVWLYVKDANGDPVEAGQRFILSGTDENGKLVSYSAETDAFGFICYPRVPFGSYSISCDSVRSDGSAWFVDNGSINVLQYPPVKRETRWTLAVEEGTFVYPHQRNNVTATADAAIAGEKYVLTVVPKSSITGSVEDYIFDVFAVEAKNKIDKDVADGVISSFEEGLLSGDSGIISEDLPAKVYVLLVGFDATGYVTGLYQWAEVAVADKMPTYYRWAGKWKITGREVPYSGVTWVQPETWTITIDEDNLEKTLTVHGINSITTAVVVQYDAAVFKFTYNEEDGSIKFLSQHGPTFPYSASYGDSNMMPQGLYTKNGTSYTRVSSVGYEIFSATMSEDFSTATVKPGIRTTGGVDYDYAAFRLYLLAGTGSTYTLSASSGVIPLPFEMTRIE